MDTGQPEERSTALTSFLWRAAHNMRAPLVAMITMLGVVRREMLGPLNKEQQEYLRRVERRAHSIARMIDKLMLLARSEAEGRTNDHEPVDFVFLAGRLDRTFEEEAGERGLAFRVSVPKTLPAVLGDRRLLEQLLENLVSNALKYTPRGSVEMHLSVTAEPALKIEVIDTGIGIPKEAEPNLLTEFYRAPNARQLEESGTGLGLALVARTVKQHGGTLEWKSAVDKGTTFTVTLPVIEES